MQDWLSKKLHFPLFQNCLKLLKIVAQPKMRELLSEVNQVFCFAVCIYDFLRKLNFHAKNGEITFVGFVDFY